MHQEHFIIYILVSHNFFRNTTFFTVILAKHDILRYSNILSETQKLYVAYKGARLSWAFMAIVNITA